MEMTTTVNRTKLDEARREASQKLDPAKRSQLGQFMTPTATADFMASLFECWPNRIRLLDPGAGIGSLTEAFAARFIKQAPKGAQLEAHCYEIEPMLIEYLADHLKTLEVGMSKSGKHLVSTIHERDFIADATYQLGMRGPTYTHAILNPPYKKINTDSNHRRMLRQVGVETVNLYSAFLALTIAMMDEGGEVVAIVPRSFCNGSYYRPFREYLLARCAIRQMHVFESRTKAFQDDEVLQENVIIYLVRGAAQREVIVSVSHDTTRHDYQARQLPFDEVVKPGDTERFIHIPTEEASAHPHLFTASLADLGLSVSTGPVVDFRMKDYWLAKPHGKCVPLLYAHHFKNGAFTWPREHKKPNALTLCDEVQKWLMPRGFYTLTKRFSAKEERRRLVAFVVDPAVLPHDAYGFENHLNVFHSGKRGIPEDLAHGLAIFLNSTAADLHFRNFSGHTQVNATDLRTMRYPDRQSLKRLGEWAMKHAGARQEEIDEQVEGGSKKSV
jgi:tRNA1(Val) A37 N6-methylase TrmN6